MNRTLRDLREDMSEETECLYFKGKNESELFYQIKNVTEHEYTLVDCNGNVTTLPIQEVDKTASVFTIEDAKDGDVLFHSDSASNGIFKGFTFSFKG